MRLVKTGAGGFAAVLAVSPHALDDQSSGHYMLSQSLLSAVDIFYIIAASYWTNFKNRYEIIQLKPSARTLLFNLEKRMAKIHQCFLLGF